MYKTIMIDPPWYERGGGKIKRGADRHYPLIKDIATMEAVIRESGLWEPDPSGAHLYLWVTNNHLPEGLELMKRLGFRYVTNLCWAKPSFGLGRYFRGQHELCLFGVTGNFMQPADRRLSTLVHAPKRAHSEKPIEVIRHIEVASIPPRLELFATRARPGWTCWGRDPTNGAMVTWPGEGNP